MAVGGATMFRLGFNPIGRPLMHAHFYMVGNLLIDTGFRNMRKAALGLIEGRKVETVLLTHHHEDHSGNAAMIRKRHGATVCGHPLAVEKMKKPYRILPYQHIMWGKTDPVKMKPLPPIIETGAFRFVPIHTPGHSRDHTVYLEENNGWLFSGDLFLGERIKFFRIDEKFADQLRSLKKILAYDFDTVFCGHRPRLAGGKKAIQNKLRFLEDTHGKIIALAEKGLSEKEIAKRMNGNRDRFVYVFTMGNACFANMVRSAMRDVA